MKFQDELKYIQEIWLREEQFKNQSQNYRKPNLNLVNTKSRAKRFVKLFCFGVSSVLDFFLLIASLVNIRILMREKGNILYVAKNFCVEIEGKLELRISKGLFSQNTILVNTSKEFHICRIGESKVYNIGYLILFIAHLLSGENKSSRLYQAHKIINNFIMSFSKSLKSIYFYWFYDLNSFSLIFSENRKYNELIEIQHGSIINYPPYEFPAPVKIADVFYVRNEMTIFYLKQNLCRDFDCEYRLINYPFVNRRVVPGLNILYASTIELQGFHPVFKNFLKDLKNLVPAEKLNLSIRLHPRECGREDLFLDDLMNSGVDFKFDHSEDWLFSNAIEGLIVVSPWSSTLEEAFDNGFRAVTIDEVGKRRFNNFFCDEKFCYSDNIINTLCNWGFRIK